ncbi:uncharacterized protein N7515_002004 [Penicillium bovifimosum]|uniref:Uncharacterized protein n=1 Tax=Penicillium bovifimosum TaxID=126998 RepID=A0A9W9HAR6_9EURO|nr:uncharacterized protein N7515_002004 [Penicillium bovifimosum]KAJ5143217.1 hypothetical protein N7515_002004 [Penicillium bovifimosum]
MTPYRHGRQRSASQPKNSSPACSRKQADCAHRSNASDHASGLANSHSSPQTLSHCKPEDNLRRERAIEPNHYLAVEYAFGLGI